MTARDDIPADVRLAAIREHVNSVQEASADGYDEWAKQNGYETSRAYWKRRALEAEAALASRPAPHEADRDRAAEEERIREDERTIADLREALLVARGLLPASHPIGAPEPLMHPNAEWCERYERWHRRALRFAMQLDREAAALRSRTPAPSRNQDGET